MLRSAALSIHLRAPPLQRGKFPGLRRFSATGDLSTSSLAVHVRKGAAGWWFVSVATTTIVCSMRSWFALDGLPCVVPNLTTIWVSAGR